MFEHVLSAILALQANKIRAALTMLGVVIGVLAVTLLVGVGDGARIYLDQQISGLGTNLITIVPGRRETRGFGPPAANSAKPLVMEDVRALERHASLLRGVTPIVMGGGAVRFSGRTRDTMVLGVAPSFSDLRNMHVDRGVFVRDEDVDARRRVCVLGRTIVREIFGDENPLGQSVRIADGRFRVVGVMEDKGRSLGFDLDDLVFVPVTAAMDLFSQDFFTQIVTAARSKNDAPAAAEEIEEILARRRNGEKTFTIQSQDDLLKTFGALTGVMTLMLLAIASISLVVGGIGIMNIMLVSVRERTREIGVRRAVGATKSDILWQFLLESVMISSVGGGIGLATGGGIVLLLNHYAPSVPVALSAWIAAVAFGSSFVVGVLSGVVPARRAAELDPVEALRYE
ncbi:MAG: ABC transporter permease [Deltaproteobacteria bacterium]|nr:ABC transporter permease [Deltaproteobacteria bacterium]